MVGNPFLAAVGLLSVGLSILVADLASAAPASAFALDGVVLAAGVVVGVVQFRRHGYVPFVLAPRDVVVLGVLLMVGLAGLFEPLLYLWNRRDAHSRGSEVTLEIVEKEERYSTGLWRETRLAVFSLQVAVPGANAPARHGEVRVTRADFEAHRVGDRVAGLAGGGRYFLGNQQGVPLASLGFHPLALVMLVAAWQTVSSRLRKKG